MLSISENGMEENKVEDFMDRLMFDLFLLS